MASFRVDRKDLDDMLDVEVNRILQWQTPFPVAAFLVAVWLRPSVPGWAAVTLGMAIAWLISIGLAVREQGGMFIVNDGITDMGFLPRRYLSQEEIAILTERQHSHCRATR